jgi:hypothetical protein
MERREDMKRGIILIGVLLLLVVICVPAMSQTPDPANELDNPCFVSGNNGWEFSEQVQFNQSEYLVFDRPHVAYDPWPIPGAAGSIRQIVDNTRSPLWNWDYNRKIATLSFDVYTTGEAYVVVGFDWWDTMSDTKPVGPGQYEELLPDHFQGQNTWTRYTVTYDWANKPGLTHQPRWISIEFGFFGCSGTGYEAAVDDVVLKSQCVPEPSGLLAVAGSLIGGAGLAWRRRR